MQHGRHGRDDVESAFKVISEILETDNKSKALGQFVKQYVEVIGGIFRRIHAPKEFKGLASSGLHVVRESDDSLASLSNVSTGQRSAIALSIFFALNSSIRKGPPIVMIDDPIAYVDDLNTLSFLDYLREIAVTLNRQIFFATANDKLAALFAKKFDFLGAKDFKTLVFERN